MSDFARRLSRVPEQPLIDEMQAALDNHPDNHDRDAGRHCLTCQHDLELDADFRCTRCGSPS